MSFSPSSPPQTGRSVAVGLFERTAQAQEAVQALRGFGLADEQIGLVRPDALNTIPGSGEPRLTTGEVTGLLATTGAAGDLSSVLVALGLPEGEARFYAREVQAGRALVVVEAGASYAAARHLLGNHGGTDVQSEGEQLARGGDTPDGAAGGVGGPPPDLTGRWEDVRSRYEMLFEQHYGTTDVTWPEAEPLYRYAWETANAPAHRGQPWASVEGRLRREWEADSRSPAWPEVAGPIRDVWEDVAAEAARGAEGGAARRVARQGADQAGPASEVRTPRGPA